ncbi:MAG: FAD-binding protein, partial [Planctomycetota bacterium]
MQWPCASLPGADLRDRTTLRVGGPVAWLLEPADPEQLREAIGAVRERGLPLRILGGGANVVVDDAGLEGVVISTERLNRIFRPGDLSAEETLDEALPS